MFFAVEKTSKTEYEYVFTGLSDMSHLLTYRNDQE